jgi:hypothetical protein
MEESTEFRFCRVCLVPEEEGLKTRKFRSIFENNGKVAQKLFNISQIIPIDVDEKVPSLICLACTKEVFDADLLRKRILDANEHITMLTSERENELFEEELKELKRKLNINKENEHQSKPLETSTKKNIENSSKQFYVPNVFIHRKNPDDKKVKYLFKLESETEKFVQKSTLLQKAVKVSKIPDSKMDVKILKAKQQQKEKYLKKTNEKPKVEEIKPTDLLEKKLKKKKMPAGENLNFKCGSCHEYYFSRKNLDRHMETHQCKNVFKILSTFFKLFLF